MDFAWSEEQVAGQRQARRLGEQELSGAAAGENRRRWAACARFGIQALNTPTEWGGLGLDARTCVYTLEGLGQGCRDNGLLMGLGAQLWSVVPPLLAFGTVAQKQAWLPEMAKGEVVAGFALTEAGAGSDAFRLTTRAVRQPGGFTLSGCKQFVTNAPVAEVFLVFATTDPQAGYLGITAFLVPRATPGVAIGPALKKMGLESSPTAEVQLDGAFVAETAVVGEVGGGGAVLRQALEWERGCLLAPALGTMARLLEASTAHTQQRRQFGRPVIEFEAVGARLAQMRLRLELSRLLLYEFAWLKDAHRPAAVQASMVKLYVSESYREAAGAALHLHGAYGYTREYEFEQVWRDAMGSHPP